MASRSDLARADIGWELKKIISVCWALIDEGESAASTGEVLAACFVLGRMDLLPLSWCDPVEAWDRVGLVWQGFVREIKSNYMDLVEAS